MRLCANGNEKFANGDVFRSASEICEMYLVPEGKVWEGREDMKSFWNRHRLTGDNVKERPYTNMYPRLTVTVQHFQGAFVCSVSDQGPRARRPMCGKLDAMSSPVNTAAPQLSNARSVQTTPTSPTTPSRFQRQAELPPLDQYYTYRIVNVKRFAP